ncbi:pilus assembly protein PilM [uncultured Bifidobacterium sp.]|uniref:pilus assembly protein PilM n=1 Tax=uncultured Bifidobacterium sp. TaxID=165187 RepID=UPI0028DBBE0F|nr:pilus assembly protein PilM [uncultured Bifidobacterium sp.]
MPLSREEQPQGGVLHGLIVATLAAGLEKTAKAVESAGMFVTSVDTSAFSLARMFSEDSQEHTVAVINVGSNSTDVIILDKGGPVYLRSVPSGADDVTQAISIALSVPFEDANDIKQHLGLRNVVGDPRLEKAEEIIRETTSQLIVGIRNTLNYYDNDRRYDGTVDDIILTGVGSQLGGFPPVLATSTNKVVRLGDPFSKFALTKQAREQEAPSHSSAYAIVLGLAMGRRLR